MPTRGILSGCGVFIRCVEVIVVILPDTLSTLAQCFSRTVVLVMRATYLFDCVLSLDIPEPERLTIVLVLLASQFSVLVTASSRALLVCSSVVVCLSCGGPMMSRLGRGGCTLKFLLIVVVHRLRLLGIKECKNAEEIAGFRALSFKVLELTYKRCRNRSVLVV
jgi:hypothetical protein